MLDLTSTLQQKLDQRATTFCHCWRIATNDGRVLGFTDHDRDLSFNGVTFRANTSLSASEAESSLGLAATTTEAAGALSDDSLSESDLLNGVYDGASVEIWLVDWTNSDDRTLLDIASIGEVRRGEHAFSAELRSNAHFFDQPQGRTFQRGCSADLGDARCKVNLAACSIAGVVVASAGGVVTVDLANAEPTGFFTGGVLRFSSGSNAGAKFVVKSHRLEAGLRGSIELWTPPAGEIAAGDAVLLTAGCDKTPATCWNKFANIANFRGFPHMPGNDRVIAYPGSRQPAMDGGSLFR
ncbi:MAG: DUF2163 domain-containing protein [Methylocystis sp.]|uniref:DUF2163 domain-containing protein n=1 Tax=Methylocystis sp. TaxID=1911079 RepID=UPI003DA5E618